MILLENISKRYGDTHAVRSLDLQVPPGELFGFLGPNGAGKTTTIRIIGGLIAPTTGRVFIDGIDMQREPERAKRCIGLIPDRPFLYEKLSGLEFMRFTADLYGVSGDNLVQRAERLLDFFGLLERSNELIESYSHGMKQRLIMASSLLHEPPLIVVDEPMVGLDPKGIKMVRELFRELVSGGTTIFMSTHTLKLAEDVCDRIGIINKGRLVATGSIAELKQAARVGDADLEEAFLRLTQEETFDAPGDYAN
jgi:ABC-2 type transport system ATP-binding protein